MATACATAQLHHRCADATELRFEANGLVVAKLAAYTALDLLLRQTCSPDVRAPGPWVSGRIFLQSQWRANFNAFAAFIAAVGAEGDFRKAPVADHQHRCRTNIDALQTARAFLDKQRVAITCPRRAWRAGLGRG